MPDGSLIFPASEYQRRIQALQSGMQDSQIDALLLTTPPDVFYVTGFLTRFWESPARPWFIVIPATAPPIAVIPGIGADLMGRTWLADIRTWDAPDPFDDGISLLADTLASVVPGNGRIGLPMGLETHVRMPMADYARLGTALGARQMVDATGVVQRVREIKSEAEVDKIRTICRSADAAFARVPEFARAGTPLDQVFRAFQIALLQEGADWVSYVAGGAGRGGYGDVISPADARPLQRGDLLMLDTGAVRDGYFCDFDRNYSVGPPADDTARAHAALHEATTEVLETLRPGITARDLHAQLTTALRNRSMTPGDGRLGHGLGLSLTEWPSLTAKDRTPLRAGMVLTLEPGVEIAPGRVIVHEENIVLRDTGPELLSSRAPALLPVLAT